MPALDLCISDHADSIIGQRAAELGVTVAEYLRRALNTYIFLNRNAFADGTVIVEAVDGRRTTVLL